jgi:hypothetical protein
MTLLPRQARDKHKETSEEKAVVCRTTTPAATVSYRTARFFRTRRMSPRKLAKRGRKCPALRPAPARTTAPLAWNTALLAFAATSQTAERASVVRNYPLDNAAARVAWAARTSCSCILSPAPFRCHPGLRRLIPPTANARRAQRPSHSRARPRKDTRFAHQTPASFRSCSGQY